MADRLGAGVFQRRSRHRVTRFQVARLFPESQPICQWLAELSARGRWPEAARISRRTVRCVAPPALNRVVPYYVTNMWMATYDNGLAATCYGPCKVTALAADLRAGRNHLQNRLSLQ